MKELDDLQIYLGCDLVINDKITVRQPKIKDIIDIGEPEYFSMVHILTSIPSDHKSMLFDAGIDWMEISDFHFFCLRSPSLTQENTNPLLGDLDLSKFKTFNNSDGDLVLYDEENDIVIDQHIRYLMSDFICKCHGIVPKVEKAANKYTKEYLIKEDRDKRKRAELNKDKPKSGLQPLISALVNSPEFKYNFQSILDLTPYQLKDSVKRISAMRQSSVLSNGIYANGVDTKKLDNKLLDWTRTL